MKKYIIYLLYLLLALPCFTACSDDDKPFLLTREPEEENQDGNVDENFDESKLVDGFNFNPMQEVAAIPDADKQLDIYFKANEESALYGHTEDCYLHAGIIVDGTWTCVPAAWDENLDKCKMSLITSNVWKISLTPSIREWFDSGDTPIEELGLLIRSADGTMKGLEEDYFTETSDSKFSGFTPGEVVEATMPNGLEYGINIIDDSTVALVLYEKDKNGNRKDYAYVMGDFNDWKLANDETSRMYRDEAAGCWWILLNGLDRTKEYAFQYYLGDKNEEMRIADPYSEKILDSGNDSYIPSSTYPESMRQYPEKGAGVVSVFKIAKDNFAWKNDDFRIEDKNNLMIYELLLRDFSETGDLNGAMAKLDYLEDLGVNAIELMPVQEFDGNDSWGYNPCFYFAMDKAYGTQEMYKKFIDECHGRGIAVILDVVYNHATGSHPFARLYWDSKNNQTADNNPWFNVTAPHPYNVFHDFNHEEPMVRQFVKRNLEFLLNEYHIDGFRFDLTKGFTQNKSDEGSASNYDASRINILKDYYNTIQSVRQDAVMIIEHFCNEDEENVLSAAGILPWCQMNDAYCQSGMGYQERSGFENSRFKEGWVGFMESHDEERTAFKAKAYGNGAVGQNLKYRMNSMAANAAFCFMQPGSKMLWQFGEMGYDISIEDGGRTGKKPLHWEYLDNPYRKELHDVYTKLLNLRQVKPDLFRSNYIVEKKISEYNWWGGRGLKIENGSDKIVVIGNFTPQTINNYSEISLDGVYYNYITGEPKPAVVSVPAHGFVIYTSFEPATLSD